MKVLFVLENYYPHIGGVETLFRSLVKALVQKGHEVTVLTNRFDRNLAPEELVDGARIRRVNFINRYIFTFLAWGHVAYYARHHDLIHTTSYNAGIPAFIGGMISRKKTIITFHEVWGKLWFRLPHFDYLTKWGHYLFEKLLLKLPFNKFVAVSEYTETRLAEVGVPQTKITKIYNGIDYEDWQPTKINTSDSGEFRFLYFGRLGISKGLDLLIPAFSQLAMTEKSFSLTLIIPRIPASLLNEVKTMIAENSPGADIKIKHHLSFEELKHEVGHASCVVIPSYSEGFCYTAVESMAMQIPIIHSGKGALTEVVGGKYIIMPEFSVNGLKAAMQNALQGKWQIKEQQTFKLSDAVNEYINLYKDISES